MADSPGLESSPPSLPPDHTPPSQCEIREWCRSSQTWIAATLSCRHDTVMASASPGLARKGALDPSCAGAFFVGLAFAPPPCDGEEDGEPDRRISFSIIHASRVLVETFQLHSSPSPPPSLTQPYGDGHPPERFATNLSGSCLPDTRKWRSSGASRGQPTSRSTRSLSRGLLRRGLTPLQAK